MTFPRKTLWLVLTAIPTLLIATAATWILIQFLAIRDRLGPWHLTVHDADGVEVGHGTLTLVATAWTTHWSSSPPYVAFTPALADDAGTVDIVPPVIDFQDQFTNGARHDLLDPRIYPGPPFTVVVFMTPSKSLTIDLTNDQPQAMGMTYWGKWSEPGSRPLTFRITRKP